MEKTELIITALTQRIAEIVSQYEADLANLRSDFTLTWDQLQESFKNYEEMEQKVKDLEEQLEGKKQAELAYQNMVKKLDQENSKLKKIKPSASSDKEKPARKKAVNAKNTNE